MKRLIFHVDVNNAFLSWTAVWKLKNGEKKDIRNEVAVIGGDEKKRAGIVLAKSNPAKKFGIVTAETLYSARKKYKDLKIYPTNHLLYRHYSDELYSFLCQYSPLIERYSVDECFLDMTGMERIIKDPEQFAFELKEKIKRELGYTVNVGIGNNKLGAKMASDFEKPDKVHTLYLEEVKEKMWPLNVSELFMVGRRSFDKLNKMGITTIGDLANTEVEILNKMFKSYGTLIHDYAWGIDDSPVTDLDEIKGIGNSFTLPRDIDDETELKKYLYKLSDMVGMRLRYEQKWASTITLWIKYFDFTTITHQRKLKNETNNTADIYKYASELFVECYKEEKVRGIGVRCSNLRVKSVHQLSLFEDDNKVIEDDRLQQTIDKLRIKYGKKTISVAILKEDDGK